MPARISMATVGLAALALLATIASVAVYPEGRNLWEAGGHVLGEPPEAPLAGLARSVTGATGYSVAVEGPVEGLVEAGPSLFPQVGGVVVVPAMGVWLGPGGGEVSWLEVGAAAARASYIEARGVAVVPHHGPLEGREVLVSFELRLTLDGETVTYTFLEPAHHGPSSGMPGHRHGMP